MKLKFLTLLAPLISAQKCQDTEEWKDNSGRGCSSYAGMCSQNQLRAGQEAQSGEKNNFPEINCCACGKDKYGNLPESAPPEKPNMCVHTPENGESIYVASLCRLLTT